MITKLLSQTLYGTTLKFKAIKQDIVDECGMGMNGDELVLTFTHSSPLEMNMDEWGMNGG